MVFLDLLIKINFFGQNPPRNRGYLNFIRIFNRIQNQTSRNWSFSHPKQDMAWKYYFFIHLPSIYFSPDICFFLLPASALPTCQIQNDVPFLLQSLPAVFLTLPLCHLIKINFNLTCCPSLSISKPCRKPLQFGLKTALLNSTWDTPGLLFNCSLVLSYSCLIFPWFLPGISAPLSVLTFTAKCDIL